MTLPHRWKPSLVVTILALGVLAGPVSAPAQQDSPQPGRSASGAAADDPLLQKVGQAIDVSRRRRLAANVHTPWQIMHGVLAFGKDFQVKRNGQLVSAIDWMSRGVRFEGEPWFQKTRFGGRAHPYSRPYAFEGHANQFLAILAAGKIPGDHEFQTPNGPVTVADMVKHAQMEYDGRDEVTWTLWGLAHYLGPDAQWENKWGEPWSIERLVRMQTEQATGDAACGGTHGLFALSYARNVYRQTGRPLRGVWLEADQKIRRYVQAARAYQNSDGTFSTNYFEGYGSTNDYNEQCQTSGHTLEFLMMALPKERLKEQWVRRGVAAVADGLIEHRTEPVECGPLYHALSGLTIYRRRMLPERVATGDSSEATPRTAAKPPQPATTAEHDADENSAVAEQRAAVSRLRKQLQAKKSEAEAKRREAERLQARARQAATEAEQAEQAVQQAKTALQEAQAALEQKSEGVKAVGGTVEDSSAGGE